MTRAGALIPTRGLQASGKTTWARHQLEQAEPGEVVRLNRDDLRLSMHGGPFFAHTTEKQITLVQHGGIDALLAEGVTVIVDDTNLRARHLRTLAEIAWRNEAEFRVQDFTDVPVEECIVRDRARLGTGASVGEAVIRATHAKFLAGRALPLPVPQRPAVVLGEPYVPPAHAPRVVMVDVDGTVALHGDRDPYDETRYHEDHPNEAVIEMVRAAYHAGNGIVYCSGRTSDYWDVTAAWLEKHVRVPFMGLFMRPPDEPRQRRRDDLVKLALFDKHIRHAYHVVCVFDDRDRVVRAWRGIGLTVMQVAPGLF